MINRARVLGALCVAVALLAGCGAEPPTAGQATPFAAVCARENDGRRVAVDGYLIFPDSFTDSALLHNPWKGGYTEHWDARKGGRARWDGSISSGGR